jgi:hypothetical protein
MHLAKRTFVGAIINNKPRGQGYLQGFSLQTLTNSFILNNIPRRTRVGVPVDG